MIGATIGIALFYLVSIVLSFFNVSIPFVWDTGPIGIIFSLVVIAVAAFNLLLDFDLIERGTAAGMPRLHELVRRVRACWSPSSGCTWRCCGCWPGIGE